MPPFSMERQLLRVDVSNDSIVVACCRPILRASPRGSGPATKRVRPVMTSNASSPRCGVVAPLIPKDSGDRVETDRRDARRLTGLHQAVELTRPVSRVLVSFVSRWSASWGIV